MATTDEIVTELPLLLNETEDAFTNDGDLGLSGSNFWCLWTILFVGLICILICCFWKFNSDEPGEQTRRNNTRSGRSYVATDQYPGPPIDGEARQLGSTRLPSYNRAVRHQSRANRTPPPEYKHYNYQGPSTFLDSVKSVITDSFMSWYSNDNDDETTPVCVHRADVAGLCDSRTDRLDEIREEESSLDPTKAKSYKIV